MNTKYFCSECESPIPEPPEKWRGHLVMECPNSDSSGKHGAIDYGLMGSPWIGYWNIKGARDGD